MTHNHNPKSDRPSRGILSEHDRHTQSIERIYGQYQQAVLEQIISETADEEDPESGEEVGEVFGFSKPSAIVSFLENEINDFGLLLAGRAGSETIAHAAFIRYDYTTGKTRWKGIDRNSFTKFLKDCNCGGPFDSTVLIKLETLLSSDDGSLLRMFGKCSKCDELHITPLRSVQCYIAFKEGDRWNLLKRPGSAVA